MLKRSSITTAFAHITHCAWKVTKPFEHHGLSLSMEWGNAKIDFCQLQVPKSNTHRKHNCLYFIFSALNKLEKSIQFGKLAFISAYVSIWRGNKVSFIFVLLQATIRSHIKHTIIFLGWTEVIFLIVPVLCLGNATVGEEVWWMVCQSTHLCSATLVPRISVSCTACCPPALELMPARHNKY